MIRKVAVHKFPQNSYNFLYEVEAGLVLQSSEVKSIRNSTPSLRDSYAVLYNSEIFLKDLNLVKALNATREKKLLLHKRQIKKIIGLYSKKSCLIIAKELIEKNGLFKIIIGIGTKNSEVNRKAKIIEKDLQKRIRMEINFSA